MMKFSRYFSFVCILAIACVLTVGCEKMEKPVMDAMDMTMTETPTETPAEMDDTETPAEMDDTETPTEMDDTETPAETDDTETPAEMDVDAILSISPTEIALPEVGEQFTITVNIDSKVTVSSYDIYLTFDATVLKYVEHSIPNYLSENEAEIIDLSLEHSMVDDGNITIVAGSLTSTGSGEGTLASVTFEVIDKQASTIVLSDVEVAGDANGLLDFTISEDTVVIQ